MRHSKWFSILILGLLITAFVLPLSPASAQTDVQQRNKDATRLLLGYIATGDAEIGVYVNPNGDLVLLPKLS